MLNINKILVVIAVLFLAGCAANYSAKVNFDRNTDIETINYKTFAWLNERKMLSGPQDLNPVMKVRIDKAIENEFIAQGYKLVSDAESADFAVSYTLGSREKIRVDSYPSSYRTGFGWGRGYYGGIGMGTDTTVRQYTEGKLAIDVFDVKARQPVWHGWGVKRITTSSKENPEVVINTVVNQIVSQFK